MNEGVREPVGFLCRWCLLALTLATVGTVLGAGLLGTAAVTADLEAGLVIGDSIWQLGGNVPMYLTGYINSSPIRNVSDSLLLSGRPGEWRLPVPTYKEQIHPPLLRPQAGVNRLVVAGFPYGEFAFESRQARLLVVHPGAKVFLFDARTAVSFPPKQAGMLRRCLIELSRRGEPAFFHPGPLRQFVKARKLLRQAGLDLPMLCEVKKPQDPTYVLRQAARHLNRWEHKENLCIITGDVKLARAAAGQGFTTHLLAPEGLKVQPHRHLQRHRSLGKFKEYLAAEPIAY